MSLYPGLDEIKKAIAETTEKNQTLFETRKSLRSILSQLFLFIISACIVIAINLFFPDANLLSIFHANIHISPRWLGIIPALFFLETLRQYHDDLYRFTAHNLTHYDGRLSLNYSVPNIRYVDIRAVVVYQDIFGRILDYGDIEIDTSAQEMTEMYIQGVRAPAELAELIELLRELSKKTVREKNPSAEAREIDQD